MMQLQVLPPTFELAFAGKRRELIEKMNVSSGLLERLRDGGIINGEEYHAVKVFPALPFICAYCSRPACHFYHAMLCVGAVFAVVRCRSVRLSVPLSRWCIVSTRLKMSSIFFYRPGRIIILVFDSQRQYPISRETPPAWAQNTRVCGKILRFSTEIAVYLGDGTIQALVCYGTSIGSHRRRIDLCQFL